MVGQFCQLITVGTVDRNSPPLGNKADNVLGVSSHSDTKNQLATIDMDIEIYNQQVLGRILARLNQLPDVIDAKRRH